MRISPRTRQMLMVMLKENRMMSVQQLADSMGISKRTAQRELEYLDSSLKGTGVAFMSKKGSGIWLEGEKKEKDRLENMLREQDGFDAGRRSDRRQHLIFELLKEKNINKLYYYSNKFQVSEATVSKDLKEAQAWLAQYGLQAAKKPEGTIEIEGDEADYRRAIRAFIRENLDTNFLTDAYEEGAANEQAFYQSGFDQILSEDILKKVSRCVSDTEGGRPQNLTQSSYAGLLLHLTIALQRILKQDVLRENESWNEALADSAEYKTAEKIARALEKEFGIEIPRMEISYICLHLKAAKHEKIQLGGNWFMEMENRGFPQMVGEMIDAFDKESAYWLKQDDEFLQGLLAHLQPTVIRILYHLQLVNPVLDSVKEEYAQIYQKCTLVAQVMEKWLQQKIPEAEIGFLAIHFGAAMMRLEAAKDEYRVVNMGVVCSSGIGVSRLMSTKLAREFRSRVKLKVYGTKDITPDIVSKTDFFVSSMPMEPQGVPVVFVNPLLSAADMEQIRGLVRRFERSSPKIMDGAESGGRMKLMLSVAEQISLLVEHMITFRVKNDVSLEELLAAIGKTLSPYQNLSERIQEDLYRREKIASQIFAEFGFGLFHARTSGTFWPLFAVCLPKEPGKFTDPYMKGVAAVFVMLIPDDDDIDVNSELLGYITNLLLDDEEFMQIALTGNEKECKEYLSICLKKFFREYL